MRAPDERKSARAEMTGSAKQPISPLVETWFASAYAQGRFGGLQARHSSHSERRRVVASLLAMTNCVERDVAHDTKTLRTGRHRRARLLSPFCRRTRMALAHKGFSAQSIPW